jgi:hypothetical protein
MQNLPAADQKFAAESIKKLGESPIADDIKTHLLMIYLVNAVGYDALKSAKESLGDKLG